MKIINYILIFCFCVIFISACSESPKKRQSKVNPVDSCKSIKIDNFCVEPKLNLDFNTLIKSSDDTLSLSVCGDYVYHPFGQLTASSELATSRLKNFKVISSRGNAELFGIKHNSSMLQLYFTNDSESVKSSYIRGGEIYDSDVNFINGMKIGMKVSDFYDVLFVDFPPKLYNNYSVIVLESCVNGIRHIYNFRENKLFSVKFECLDCNQNIER